jgi:hypothetical protein
MDHSDLTTSEGMTSGMQHHMGQGLSPDMQRCIEECLDCHSICLQTVTYCLEMGDKHAEAGHIRLLLDCTEICQTSANFMLRGSKLHGRVCGVCAEVCERCAQSCEQFGDDAQMRACAESCRRCAASCKSMASTSMM